MTKGECIEYFIFKKVSEYSLVEWLEEHDILEEDFDKFMKAGREAVDNEH